MREAPKANNKKFEQIGSPKIWSECNKRAYRHINRNVKRTRINRQQDDPNNIRI